MTGYERFTCEQVIAAIEGTGGVKTLIAKRLGCCRNTLDRYIAQHSTVAKAYKAERESIADLAEVAFVKKIKDGFWPAIRLALMTLGKDRGFIGASSGELVLKVIYDEPDGTPETGTPKAA